MSSLQEIKNRLNSVTSTKKITKTMQMVASAKLRRSKNNLESIQEYYMAIEETFKKLICSLKDDFNLGPKKKKKSTLFIVITSDIGLCGAYNSNILKLTKKLLTSNDKIIMFGLKGSNAFKKDKRIILVKEHIGDNPNYLIASESSKYVISNYLNGEIDKVELIFTKFINSITFNAQPVTIFPILKQKKNINSNFEFEPNPEVVVHNALNLYISAIIYGALMESKVSEMSSRRIAMENASDNAGELIEKLNLEYNQIRQSTITQEISEIISGSEIE